MAIFTAISTFVLPGAGALSIFGLSPAVTSAIFAVGRSALWSLTAAALTKPDVPRQQVMATLTQTDQPRVRAYGRNLLGGLRAFWEAKDGRLYQIVVIHHGRVDGLIRFWIDGEPVTRNASTGEVERYKYIWFRNGSGAGGDYPELLADFADIWTAEHRLQGQATFCSQWGDPADEDFAKVFPKGPYTQVQAEVRASRVLDLVGERVYSENAALCIRDFFTSPDGWNIPLSRLDTASWSYLTNLADERVPLAAGGTEPRYRLCGFHTLSDALKDTTARMLATCDGQVYETADGTIGILGGAWTEPDVTITAQDILSLRMEPGFDPFTDYNVQQGSYVSPDHSYQPTEVPEWVDAAALVEQERRTTLFDVDMCPSGTQLQRLMAIKRAKDRREFVGTLRTNLVGMKARFPKGEGIHTIRVIAEEFGINGVFEVTSHSFSVVDGFCEIGIASISNPYIWNAAADERPLPPPVDQIGKPASQDPIPQGAILTQEIVTVSGDARGVKLALTVNDPGRDGLELRAQVARGNFDPVGPWSGTQPQWVEMNAVQMRAETGILDDGQQYTVRYRWKGYATWQKAGPVTVLANPTQPPQPTDFNVLAQGDAYLEWVNAPTSYYRTQAYMGTTTTFASATLLATVAGSAGRPDNYTHPMGGATGTRHFWVRTLNSSGIPSAPVGPITRTF